MLGIESKLMGIKVKRNPIGEFTHRKTLLGTSMLKSQANPFSYNTKKEYIYQCDIVKSCKVFLSLFDEKTLFASHHGVNSIFDYQCGSIVNEKRDSESFNQIFLSIYADEISLVNPLGTARHTNRLWQIYGQVLNVPKQYRAKLDSIFLIASINTAFITKYSLNKCLKPVIKMIKEAQIPFNYENFSKPIKVTVLHFIGDSPASNFFAGNSNNHIIYYINFFCKIE